MGFMSALRIISPSDDGPPLDGAGVCNSVPAHLRRFCGKGDSPHFRSFCHDRDRRAKLGQSRHTASLDAPSAQLRLCRSAVRGHNAPTARLNYNGFRLALSAAEEKQEEKKR